MERFRFLNQHREDICHRRLGESEELRVTMNVRELIARLEIADPDDLVVVDDDSRSLFLLNQKSGMYQPLDALEEGAIFTGRDKEFLCSLRVRF